MVSSPKVDALRPLLEIAWQGQADALETYLAVHSGLPAPTSIRPWLHDLSKPLNRDWLPLLAFAPK